MTWTALGLADEFRIGRLSVAEVVRELLERLDRVSSESGGVAATHTDRVLAAADEADRQVRAGRGRRLEGVPFTVKDWIDAEGWPVTGATGDDRGQLGRVPRADATAVARLREAGGIVLATTSAMADNPLHGPTRNPRDVSRAPGGSSSGAAALVAAGVAPLALGGDSGGGLRLPAAWCGVAALRPTFGRVPLTGHFPRRGSLEDGRTVIGPIAGTVADLTAALTIIAGPDELDAGVPPVPLGDPASIDVRYLRVGVVGPEAGDSVDAAVKALEAAGAECVDAPELDVRDEAFEITLRHLAREDAGGAENLRSLQERDRFRRRMLVATSELDVLITPATTEPAPPWRETAESDYAWTLPWSLTGAPVVVLPAGTQDGLPMAVQVIGRPWQDHVALAAARVIEAAVSR